HGEHDPHAWLSPKIAKVWLNSIAAKLSEVDPDNAATYFSNAKSARDNIDALVSEVNSILDPIREKKFVVFHDAYQYFEKDFGISASGAISLGDASDPSPARLAEIRKRVVDEAVECVLAEPQYKQGLVKAVVEGTDANTAVIDPLGVKLETGPSLYENLIRNLATNLAKCF
ncbi:zinc ABC transporter substrate-binding protein, partial [Paracoccaceae bacterium]|nr:zinc ABC transporter substrate-binding protein [Paracoccaceae bacterium]